MQSFRAATNTKLLNFLNEIFNNPFLELKSYIPNQVTLVTIMKYEFITSAVKEFPVQSFIYSSALLRKLLFQIQSRDPWPDLNYVLLATNSGAPNLFNIGGDHLCQLHLWKSYQIIINLLGLLTSLFYEDHTYCQPPFFKFCSNFHTHINIY